VPILTNTKHELFAQALAKGENASKAYISAGFKGSRANASRLKANSNIAARVFELSEAGAKSAEVSVASLLAELEEARARATTLGQLSAAVRASAEKAKISGLLVERQEIAVTNVDPYEDMSTAAEVLAKVVEDLGLKAAVALATAFELPYDEAAIRAMCEAGNAANGQQAIEWRPPKVPRREL
jgi:phage terminase small subunit